MKPASLLTYLDAIRSDPIGNADYVKYYDGPIAKFV